MASPAGALPPDREAAPAVLPLPPSPHWVWVNNLVGVARLVDGDSGSYLGTLDTGYSFVRVVLPHDGKLIYSPEIYFARGMRGTRTDVVTIYDAATLSVAGEIAIPPKRSSNKPIMANSVLTDDDRFLLIYEFTPAQSIAVLDMGNRTLVGEIETPGCAFIYPTGRRSFFSICGDGGFLTVGLDDQGTVTRKARTAALFDVERDPVTEKAVRIGDTWLFVSVEGTIYPIQATDDGLSLGERWPLTTPAEHDRGWRPGGMQQLALHAGSNRLYVLMHRGGPWQHKDSGKDVWVYDLAAKRRVKEISLKHPSASIQVSQDSQPLLYSVIDSTEVLDIYDATNGKLLRSIDSIGPTPTLLVTP